MATYRLTAEEVHYYKSAANKKTFHERRSPERERETLYMKLRGGFDWSVLFEHPKHYANETSYVQWVIDRLL